MERKEQMRVFRRSRTQFETEAEAWADIRNGGHLGRTREYEIETDHTEAEWVFEVTRK